MVLLQQMFRLIDEFSEGVSDERQAKINLGTKET
jgi:hypothetical protein